jgi:hypothetical protein
LLFFRSKEANFSGMHVWTALNQDFLDSVYHQSIYHASVMSGSNCSGSSKGMWFGSERPALQKAVRPRSVWSVKPLSEV